MKSDIETSGLLWWDENLAQQSVPFSTVLFPALLGKCDSRLLLSELSLDELRIIAQHCITSNSDQVTKTDVNYSSKINKNSLFAANYFYAIVVVLSVSRPIWST